MQKQLPQDIYDELLADAERLSPVGIANTLLATIPDASVRRIAHKKPQTRAFMRWFEGVTLRSVKNMGAATHALS